MFIIQEQGLYVGVVKALCEERIWREDGVPLIQSKENPNELSWQDQTGKFSNTSYFT